MNGPIILIDDDHGPMEYYVEALRSRGFAVIHIDSADKAFEWLEDRGTKEPDLVIVDIMMPPGSRLTLEETNRGLWSGVFIARAVRDKFPGLPLVGLTNKPSDDVGEKLPVGTPMKAKFEINPFAFAEFVAQNLNRT